MTSPAFLPPALGGVLVASPSAQVRDRVLEKLKPQRGPVHVASGGAEALAKLETGNWQMLFLDRELPDLDAEELVEIIEQRYPGIRVVLVVDDEAGMRVALEMSFRKRGWQVETASGKAEALARFSQRRHSLVVTDIRMPDGDGLGVMREVRAMTPQTAVILLTAFGSVPDAVAAMKAGACEYLVKPVAFEQFGTRRRQHRCRCGSTRGPGHRRPQTAHLCATNLGTRMPTPKVMWPIGRCWLLTRC